MNSRLLMSRYRALLLIACLIQPLQADTGSSPSQISLQTQREFPLVWTAPYRFFSRSVTTRTISCFHKGLNDSLTLWFYNRTELTTAGIPGGFQLRLNNGDQQGLVFSYHRISARRNYFLNSDLGTNGALRSLRIAIQQKYIEGITGFALAYSNDSWEFNFGESPLVYNALIQRLHLLGEIHQELHWRKLLFYATASLSLFPEFYDDSDTEFSVSTKPWSRALALQVSYPWQAVHKVTLAAYMLQDTVNAVINHDNRKIGKLTAWDHTQEALHLRYRTPAMEAVLGYQHDTYLTRGQLQTAPFATLFSALSGARYYAALEAETKTYTLDVSARLVRRTRFQVKGFSTFSFISGYLQQKSYIWQLFNPLTDLSLQRWTSDLLVVQDLMLSGEVVLTKGIILNLDLGTLLVLYAAIEEHPQSDGLQGEFSPDWKGNLRLSYYF